MILLFTDFGLAGSYVGEMHAAIFARLPNPGPPVIDLMHDAPNFDIRASAYLLAALADTLPPNSVTIAVIDPGVGGMRDPAVLRIQGNDGCCRWFVGPNNGLFGPMVRRSKAGQWWRIDPHAATGGAAVSDTFHGRDLFAPVGARLAVGDLPDGGVDDQIRARFKLSGESLLGRRPWAEERPLSEAERPDWPEDLAAAIFIDRFGNVMTGLRGTSAPDHAIVRVGDTHLSRRRTFCEAEPGEVFWHRNSTGLIEIAAREASAAEHLSIAVGAPVEVVDG